MNDAALTNLLAACRTYKGGEVDAAFNNAAQAFYAAARAQPKIAARAARELRGLPPLGAFLLANMLGAMVETGGTADRSGQAVWDLFLAWLPQVQRGLSSHHPPSARQQELAEAFSVAARSVVAHLAHLPDLRMQAGADSGLVAQLGELQELTPGAGWVRQALIARSDALIVLHVPSGRGLRLRYDNVANCFHLFTLIQGAVGQCLPGGREPNRFIVDMARCITLIEDATDEAWWHYGRPHAAEPDLTTQIFGEAWVGDIPRVDGVQVILLWPPILNSRTWHTGFFSPQLFAMPASVVVEGELSAQEYQDWLTKAGPGSARERGLDRP
jgi:hypothetical protein